MQSRLFTKKAIKMSARGSILEAFGGHFGSLWVPNGTSEAFFLEVKFLVAKKSCDKIEPGGGSL